MSGKATRKLRREAARLARENATESNNQPQDPSSKSHLPFGGYIPYLDTPEAQIRMGTITIQPQQDKSQSDQAKADKPESERAATNRANSQLSTGPKTESGKAVSAQNAFKHGLYSKKVVIPGEDPAALDQLKAELRAEHKPVTIDEEILVNEIADHFWRIKRARRLEADAYADGRVVIVTKMIPIIQRTMSSAERGLHKAMTALRALQKQRGFVPQKPEPAQPEHGFVSQKPADAEDYSFALYAKEQGVPVNQEIGFVPQNPRNAGLATLA